MMWASLLLSGILSGWWGPLALATAPPANSAVARTIGGVDSGSVIGDDRRGVSGASPNEQVGYLSTTMMMMMMTSSRSTARRGFGDADGLATSLPPTSEGTTANDGLFRLASMYLRDHLKEQQQRQGDRHSDRGEVAETIRPFGIDSSASEDGPEDGPGENRGKDVERRKGISFGPFLENFTGYQVTPISAPVGGEESNRIDHLEQRDVLGPDSQPGESDVSQNGEAEDRFEDLDEIQDYYSLDDEEMSRESRKFDSRNNADGSIYPPLELMTRMPRYTTSSSSSSASTTALWAELFGPVLEGSVERPRVSRSAKQQRAKNRSRSESPREQRRKCRNKGCRGRNWCPDMDIGNRAFLAPTVFEGKARSMSSLRKPGSNYAVTFEVKQVYKSQPGFQPLQKNDSVRLHFRDKAAPGKSTLCGNVANENSGPQQQEQQQQQQQQRDNASGVVRANIKRGKVYLVFVNRVGPRNFTILGEPIIRSKKNEQAVQAVVRPDYVREVTLSELRDSVARLRDRVKLVCRTRGSPPPRVHWLKDGVLLHPRRGLRIQHKRRRSKVVISSARQEDSGRYECVAESTSGHRASLAAQLLVAHDTRIQDTTTAAWPRQEQPCPIAGDFCMNGGTCLFFETVGEPACRCAEGFTGLRCETKDVISTGSVYNRHRAPFSCKLGLSTSYYC